MSLDQLFVFSALGGGVLFLVQLVLMFVGGTVEADVDSDTETGGDATSDVSFKVLSLQGITSFVMMFGLVGWAMRADSHAGALTSMAVAVAAGVGSTWLIGRIFGFFVRLQSKGTLDMSRAEGASGQVYLAIRPDKPGQVNVTVHGRLLTLDAVTEGGKELTTGTPIRVTRVISDNSVVVEKS